MRASATVDVPDGKRWRNVLYDMHRRGELTYGSFLNQTVPELVWLPGPPPVIDDVLTRAPPPTPPPPPPPTQLATSAHPASSDLETAHPFSPRPIPPRFGHFGHAAQPSAAASEVPIATVRHRPPPYPPAALALLIGFTLGCCARSRWLRALFTRGGVGLGASRSEAEPLVTCSHTRRGGSY